MIDVEYSDHPVAFWGPTSAGIHLVVHTSGVSLTYGPENATPGQLEANVTNLTPVYIPAGKFIYYQGGPSSIAGVRLGDEFFSE